MRSIGMVPSECMAQLAQQPGFEDPCTNGTKAPVDNDRNWNITSDGLLITFDSYAPGASGPQLVLVPYARLKEIIDPTRPLGRFIQ